MQHSKINWRIGCSGFHYKDWKEIFYPAGLSPAKWFTYYCEHFHTLESNVSFYRFPALSLFQKWYRDSPAGFSFCVKAPRLITHYKKFVATEDLLADLYRVAKEGLQEKLGCILFQFPASFTYSPEKLEQIIRQLNDSFCNAMEFRHASWWQPVVYQQLQAKNVTFCDISYLNLPDEIINTSSTAYFRFHGVPDLYKSGYADDYLDKIVNSICALKNVHTAYLYFNNTASAEALKNARYLINKLQ